MWIAAKGVRKVDAEVAVGEGGRDDSGHSVRHDDMESGGPGEMKSGKGEGAM